MFEIPKRETDVREWLVFAIDSLHTSNREIRGDLELLPFTARRFEPAGRYRQGCRDAWQQVTSSAGHWGALL